MKKGKNFSVFRFFCRNFFAGIPVLLLTLTAFSRIIEEMKNGGMKIWILRIALTLACLFAFAWIFSNSLQTGEESSSQSVAVVDTVQKIVGAIAPDSPIATATGEAYDRLHGQIRTVAHFCEFALLGVLLVWCYRSYTRDKAFAFLPVALVLLTPLVDECLQTLVGGRGAELFDVFVDSLGGISGCAFAGIVLFLIWCIRRKREGK